MAEPERTDPVGAPALSRYCAIFAAACTALLYEILITRITSAILLYHFTFLSLSVAMLGLGAPGVWYALFPPGPRALGRSLLSAGVLIPSSVAIIFKLGLYLTKGEAVTVSGLPMLVLCAAMLPMLALGSAICALLVEARTQGVGRLYAVDLCGAGLGALLVIPLMRVISTPYLLAGCGLLPIAAAAIIERRLRLFAALAAVAVLAAMGWGEPFTLRYNRVYVETQAPLFERWTATGRVTVRPKDAKLERYVLGAQLMGAGSKYRPVPADHLWLLQEGGAGTAITRLSGSPATLDYLRYDVTGVGYDIWRPRQVCVIGAGGGRDVLTALHYGATHVDAIELHPEVVEALRGPFGAYSGHLYDSPQVSVIVGEGRSYLERTPRRYDYIQISMVDSWAATAAGAYALSENYLYTTEAMRTYWSRLKPGGALSMTRFYTELTTTEAIRLTYMALHALELEGVSEPLRHIAAVNASNKFTLLVSRSPLSATQLQRLAEVCPERGFAQLFPEAGTTPTRCTYTRVVGLTPRPTHAIGRDLTPPSDDRPFFFQAASLFGSLNELGPMTFNEQAVVVLRPLITALFVFSLLFFFLPFALRGRLQRHPGFARATIYFAAIGLGFMMVEMSLIQRFILYLGHPSYALTVVLATLLLAAGLGAWLAEHMPPRLRSQTALVTPICILVLNSGIPIVLPATLAAPFAARVAIAVLLLTPAGVSLGLCLPLGMLRFAASNRAWFWAVNGAMSVVGSVVATALAMSLGFSMVTLIGVAFYLASYLLLRGAKTA